MKSRLPPPVKGPSYFPDPHVHVDEIWHAPAKPRTTAGITHHYDYAINRETADTYLSPQTTFFEEAPKSSAKFPAAVVVGLVALAGVAAYLLSKQ